MFVLDAVVLFALTSVHRPLPPWRSMSSDQEKRCKADKAAHSDDIVVNAALVRLPRQTTIGLRRLQGDNVVHCSGEQHANGRHLHLRDMSSGPARSDSISANE